MTAQSYIDRIDTLEAIEEKGRLVSLTRRARVVGLDSTDWFILVQALNALGLGSGAVLGPPPYQVMKLVSRSPRLVPGTKTVVDVDLRYEREELRPVWTVDSRGQQISTQLDKNGNPILLTYTYPEDYQYDGDLAGEEVSINATVSTTKSVTEVTGEFVIGTVDPLSLSQWLVNKVNASSYAGGEPRTWKITRVQAVEFNMGTTPPRWRFRVSIAHDPDGWDPTAVFTDPNTNEFPPDVNDTEAQPGAIQKVDLLDAISFSEIFG